MKLIFKSDIKQWLDKLKPLHPVISDFCPNLKTDSPVKAIIFSVYGTLLISSSSKIQQDSISKDNLKKAMIAGGFEMNGINKPTYSLILEQLILKIKLNDKEFNLNGHPLSNVNVINVWQEIFSEAENAGLLKLTGKESLADTIMIFEILRNKVYPMAGIKEVLIKLKENGIPLGIVSNSQFYTPIILNYFLTGKFSTKQEIDLFDPELCVFSYNELKAKPDVNLFDKIVKTLANKYGLLPDDSIFMGNDMLKDILPAKRNGLRTALFSGDESSLQIRENEPKVKGMFPDFFINDFKQLLEIIKQVN